MGETVRLRSRASRALGATMVAVAVVLLVATLADQPAASLAYAAPLALFGLVGWAAFWRPYVEVSDGGVQVVNTLRTTQVPWPAIEEVEGRYGLRLRTSYGAVTAWSASAPSGRDRAAGAGSAASQAVTERLETLRGAGFLDDRRMERPQLRRRWHLEVLVPAAVLLLTWLAALALA